MKTLIADDHSVVREGLKKIINKINEITIIEEASDGPETLEKIKTQDYDLVVLDISMPGLSGLDILQSLKYEKNNMFFACKANSHRYIFGKASEYNFTCPQCGESLQNQDNNTIIVELLNKKAKYESMNKSKTKYLSYIS